MSNLLNNQTETQKPANVPEKFWDAATHSLRTDALLKSYAELEKKLGKMIDPADTAKLNAAIGVPASPADYCIDCAHGLFTPHPEINAQLHAANFTQPQAQKVYDLAAQHLVPAILDVAGQYQAEGELQRLQNEFGGPQRWQEISRQLQAWASAHLPPEAVRGLSTTYDGVMAMHRMMQDTGEQVPGVAPQGDIAVHQSDELTKLMRDPKYWQKKDPAHVAKVTAAFERQYGG